MNIELPDGRVVEIPDGVDMAQVEAALAAEFAPKEPLQMNADGTPVSEPPPGYVLNPNTGQMTSRAELRNFYDDRTSRGRAATLGGLQGATFNTGDEAIGAVGTEYDREAARAEMEANQAAHPWAYGAGEIGGAMGTAAVPGKWALGAGSIGNAMARGGVTGVLEGFGWGFGRGEGNAKNRAKTGAQDATVGAAMGAAAPAVVAGVKNAAQAASDPVAGIVAALTNKARTGRANRAIAQTVRQSGRTAADIAEDIRRAGMEGQAEYALMDATGKAGQRRASGVARAGGEGAEEIAAYLEGRQLDQPARVAGFVDDAFGTRKSKSTDLIPYDPEAAAEVSRAAQGTASRAKDVMTENRRLVANAQYRAAREGAGPVDVRGALKIIDDYTAPLKDVDITDDSTGGMLMKFRKRLAVDEKSLPDGVTSMELSDFNRIQKLKADVQEARMKAGGQTRVELAKLEKALDMALADASEGYRRANDNFAIASSNIRAVDEGADMAKRGRSADTVAQFEAMTPAQQDAARVGYADSVLEKMERNAAPTSNRAKPLTSPKATAERNAMAIDAPLFDRRLARENQMWETQNRALQGSRTADNLQDISGARNAAAGAGTVARDVANLQFGNAARNAWGMVAPYATGENEATRTLIAKALMSKDPQKYLEPALRQDMTGQQAQRIVEMLMRRGALIGAN